VIEDMKNKWALHYFRFALVVSALTFFSGPTSAEWSKRGVFVFGDIVLDFDRKVEKFGPSLSTLTDCSSDEYFCARAEIVRIVLPKACIRAGKLKVGHTWTHDGVVTKVVAIQRDDPLSNIHVITSGEVLYLADPRRKNVVYEYDHARGVTAIYFDLLDELDLIRLAVTTRLQDEVAMGRLNSYKLFFGRTTLDPFGLCLQER
jgi:hypothetical protein